MEGTKGDVFDISLLLALADFPSSYTRAIKTLYRENTFTFDDAKVMLWWLQQIGTTAVSQPRKIGISLTSGPYRGDERRPGVVVVVVEEAVLRNEQLWDVTLK